jgi:hypothetical protein
MTVGNRKRPTSVTIIACFLIIISVLGLLAALFIAPSPRFRQYVLERGWTTIQAYQRDLAVRMLLVVFSYSTYLCSGIAMLKGLNWGRMLYLCYQPINRILAFLIRGLYYGDILSITLYIIFLVLLTRPAASAFFRPGGPRE